MWKDASDDLFLEGLEMRVTSSKSSLSNLFELFAANIKWVQHMIHGIARLEGIVLKQSHVISSRVIDT